MRKKMLYNAPLLLVLLWTFGSQTVQAQCDPNNFTVTATEGTCPNNGNIAVLLPGGSPCVGWQAILTNPGGLETVLNVPDSGGPVDFSNLSVGSYMVRLVNGPTTIQSPDNPIAVTSSYQAMDITSTNTVPSCTGGADATLTIDINSGGNGPFQYTVTPATGPPQTFGPTTNTAHTFAGLNGGETVSFEVTDLGCSVSQTQDPFIDDNTALPSEYLRAAFQRKCSPNCATYDAKFFTLVNSTDRINAIQLPGNATISINGGTPQNLVLDIVNGNYVSFTYPPGLDENVPYVLSFSDGCDTFGATKTTLAVDDTLMTIDQEIAYAPDCSPIHTVDAISIAVDGLDEYSMFCGTNSITIEQETPVGSNVWVNIPLVGGAPNPLSNNFFDYYTLPGEGNYRITGIDDCHSVPVEFSTLPPTNPLDDIDIDRAPSILEGTSALSILRTPGQPSGGTIPETTYTIRPVPFQSSITINPSHPFNLGGAYTLNFPLVYTTTTNRSIIGDLPPGEYEITATDICGNLTVKTHTLFSGAVYNPEIRTFPGCANSSSIEYDLNASGVANAIGASTVNTTVELWTDDGSGNPGTFITNDAPSTGLAGSFDNLASGDYVIRFSSINFQSTNRDEVFSAAEGNNNDREYWTAVTIQPFQNITTATAGAFCDFTDPTTGIILTEITGGTPTYPIRYELFATSDLVNPVRTHNETDPSMTSHLFENVMAGDYVVRVTTPCDGIDLNINLIPAPIAATIRADNNPVCAPGGAVELSINLAPSLFDITWTDNLGNPVGTGTPITVNVNATTTYTANYSIKPLFCPAAPTNSSDITITVDPALVLVGTETANCNPLGTDYTLVVEVAGTAPYIATGTGAPGVFAGNVWTSDPIPAGTDYNVDFTDANTCNTVNVAGTAPNCCVLDLNLAASDIDLCLNPGPYSTTISGSTNGLTYEVRDQNGNPFIPALTGIGNGGDLTINIPSLNVPAGGTDYQVFVTNGVPGCNGTLVDRISFINGNPNPFLNVTGDTLCEGNAATVTLSNSQLGVNYQLLLSGIPVSPAVTAVGTGGDLVLTIPAGHPQLATGTYAIEASSPGCSTVTLNQSALITVNALPIISLTAPGSCSPDRLFYGLEVTIDQPGSTVISSAGSVVNTSGTTWSISGVNVGTDITITATNPATGCANTLAVTSPNCACPTDIVQPASGGDQSYCAGTTVPALTANPGTGGDTVFWYDAPTGGTLLLAGGTSFAPTAPGTYYAETRNTISNCSSILRTAVTLIENVLPVVGFNDPADVCTDAGIVDLTAFASPAGGSFTGTGVSGNSFDPATAGTGTHTLTYVFTDGNGCTGSDTAQITVNALLTLAGAETTSCAVNGQSYILTVRLNGTAPFNATVAGTFAGNVWTSDPIVGNTGYSIDFTDANNCNTLTVADVAPVCCVFEVSCPTFPATTVECYEDLPTATTLTETEFEALGYADGTIGDTPCGIVEVTAANGPDTGNCGATVIRTYTVTEYGDTNGNGIRDLGEDTVLNSVACTQDITVRDTTDPVFVEALPIDFTMECGTELPIAETLTATDNCSTATVAYNEEILTSGCTGSYTVLRTWEATDACGNEAVHVQMITVADTTAPTFVEALPQDGFADCDAIPEATVLTATDLCGTVTVDFSETEVPGNCSSEYSVVRTWTATDDCGNETSHTQTLQVGCPIKVYNAVSANNNGQNDIFLFEGIDCFPNNQVEIFNRWGVKVFEANGYDNLNKVFKGYSEGRLTIARGEKLPTGTYFYILQYEFTGRGESRTVQQSGYLYLSGDN